MTTLLFFLIVVAAGTLHIIVDRRWKLQQHRILMVLYDDAHIGYPQSRYAAELARVARVPRRVIHIHLASLIEANVVRMSADPDTNLETLKIRGMRPRMLYRLAGPVRDLPLAMIEAIVRGR